MSPATLARLGLHRWVPATARSQAGVCLATGSTVTARKHIARHYSTEEGQVTTFAYQDKIPKLPVPPLDQTIKQWLNSIKALTTPEEYEKASNQAADFLDTAAPILQRRLLDRAEDPRHPSWLEEWWDDGYLATRSPIVINSNYSFLLRETGDADLQKQPGTIADKPIDLPAPNHGQIERAAALVFSSLTFREMIDQEVLTPDMAGKGDNRQPLCMVQYPRLFATARIPKRNRDVIVCHQSRPVGRNHSSHTAMYVNEDSRHVVVLANGHFFASLVYDMQRNPKPPRDIAADLAQIRDMAKQMPPGPLIDFATGDDRDTWADLREKMIGENMMNESTLEAIDRAIMVVVLDDQEPNSVLDCNNSLLHDGEQGNRWFDKSQLVVFGNGRAGFNIEHSTGDGSTVLRMVEFVWDESERLLKEDVALKEAGAASATHGDPSSPLPGGAGGMSRQASMGSSMHLPLMLSEELQAEFNDSKQRQISFYNKLSQQPLRYADLGAAGIKQLGHSPDAFVQVAYQLAHYRLYGHLGATYESCATKGFLHGRTETIRSATPEALALCQALIDSNISGAEVRDLLSKATQAHVAVAKKAQIAQGCDRHLFGLKMSIHDGETVPALYQNPVYARSGTWRLSTSNCGGKSLDFFGFGPVCDDGFGFGYMIHNDAVHVNVSAWNGNEPATNPTAMSSAIAQSLQQLTQVAQ
eukprot:Clim_evm93s109 gene=Clim_evmTU93s109